MNLRDGAADFLVPGPDGTASVRSAPARTSWGRSSPPARATPGGSPRRAAARGNERPDPAEDHNQRVTDPSSAPRGDRVLDRPVVLYDGVCGFCNHAVQFLLRADRRGELRFAALQGDFARGVIDRHPELASLDSLVFVDHPGLPAERVTVRSPARRCARSITSAGRGGCCAWWGSCRHPCATCSTTASPRSATGSSADCTPARCPRPRCGRGSSRTLAAGPASGRRR